MKSIDEYCIVVDLLTYKNGKVTPRFGLFNVCYLIHTHNMYIFNNFFLKPPPYLLLIRHIFLFENLFLRQKEMPTRPFNVKFMDR